MKLNPKIIRLGLISLGVLVAAGGLHLKLTHQEQTQPPPAIRPVKTLVAKSIDEAEALQQTGEIQPRTETALSFLIGGTLIKRVVEVGDSVKAGTVLAALDDTDVSNELKSAEAELSGAISAENQATLANKRASDLLKISAISKAEAEAARLKEQMEKLRALQAQLRNQQLQADAHRNAPLRPPWNRHVAPRVERSMGSGGKLSLFHRAKPDERPASVAFPRPGDEVFVLAPARRGAQLI